MNEKDPFSVFENADDEFIEKLSDSPILTDIEKERMFKMSKDIFEEMKKNNGMDVTMTSDGNVSGVERYSRPKWYKPVMYAAASIALIAGIGVSAALMKNFRYAGDDVSPDDVRATQPITTIVTTIDNNAAAAVTTTASTDNKTSETTTTSTVSEKQENTQTSGQNEAVIPASQTTTQSTASSTESQTTSQTTETSVPSKEEQENAELIARGQELFMTACRADSSYHIGGAYETEYDSMIILDDGKCYQKVTDPNIHSVEDVVNDYKKIFSDRYPIDIEEYYIDYENAVYHIILGRGDNIFYVDSKVTEVQRIENDEIFFTVENHFDGTHIDGTAPWTEKEVFSAVIQPDGSWKVGKFIQPD